MLLTKERRPAFRSVEGWARLVLLEAGAIRECEEHGLASVLGDPHAHERAILAARHDPPPGDLVPMRVKMRRAAQQRQAATDCGGWRAGHNGGDAASWTTVSEPLACHSKYLACGHKSLLNRP